MMYGVNPKMKDIVVKTTGIPINENYYVNCQLEKGNLLVVQSEKSPGMSSPGPVTRSFPINHPNSPITLQWVDNNIGWTANMKVDHYTHPHPDGPNHYTFFSFGDHISYGGGPFPTTEKLLSKHTINYNQWIPVEGYLTRLMVGSQFCNDQKSYILEINLSSKGWAHTPVIVHNEDWYGNGTLEFLLIDRPELFNSNKVEVEWGNIIKECIINGWLTCNSVPPIVQNVYIGVEVKGCAIADLWHADFEIGEL